MTWTPIRIDFVEPGTDCHRDVNGRHGFPTGKATFLLDEESGREYPFGPTCAQITLGDRAALRRIPDFTLRDFSPVQNVQGDPPHGGGGGGGGSGGRDVATDAEKDHAFAKRYLMLRMDRVANLPGIQPGVRFPPLATIHAEFQKTRQLSDDQVRHVIALEKSEKTPAIYRSDNLLDVYTAYVQLTRLIRKETPGTRLDLLTSIRDNSLLRRLTLSDKQIAAAKLRLHPQAFQS